MTELERTESGLIKPPAHLAQEEQQKTERAGTIGELQEWIEDGHKRDLEENPYRSFTMKTPVDVLLKLTAQEREQVSVFEEQAFSRQQKSAKALDEKRSSWISAGGTEESFQDYWDLLGEHEHIAGRAAEIEERARRASSIY